MEYHELHRDLTASVTCRVSGTPVWIDQDEALLVRLVRTLAGDASVHLLCDENTNAQCLPLSPLLRASCHEPIVIPAGEEYKHLQTCEQVWRALIAQGADRNSLLINLGGGVLTDLGGFCAATFLRGVRFVHIPTTLLGMCDAAIGGKQGVDFAALKNYLGAIVQPELVWINTQFLRSLPQRHLRNGMAEVVKHAIIGDAALLSDLEAFVSNERNREMGYPEIIYRAILVKKHYVEGDESDHGVRAALNFGHSFGHALESLFLQEGKMLLHGECVALGMILETWLSHHVLGEPDRLTCRRVVSLIQRRIPVQMDMTISLGDLIPFLMKDKKVQSGIMRFTLIRGVERPAVGQNVSRHMLDALTGDPEVASVVPWLRP